MKNNQKTGWAVNTSTAPATGTGYPVKPTLINKQLLQLKLMDSLEVMKLFSICRGTLYNWRRLGLIAYSKIGGRIYFEAADVDRMLLVQKKQSWNPAT